MQFLVFLAFAVLLAFLALGWNRFVPGRVTREAVRRTGRPLRHERALSIGGIVFLVLAALGVLIDALIALFS